MRKIVFVIVLMMVPFVVLGQVEELKAKIAENPLDVESLKALLEIYYENYELENYGTTLKEVIMAVDEIPEAMYPLIEEGIEKLLENAYSDYAEEISEILFDLRPDKNSMLLYLKSLNSGWVVSEEAIRQSVNRLSEDQIEIYEFLHAESVDLYPVDLHLLVSRILVEDFGETDYLIPYIVGLIDDYDFSTARSLLSENSEFLSSSPMYYYLNGILDLEIGYYDDAVEWFLQGKSRDDGTEIYEALSLIEYIYIPEYVTDLFTAIVLANDEASLISNIQEFVLNYEELSWIFSWISRVPEPMKLAEILSDEETAVSYNTVNLDFEKINIGFYDAYASLRGTVSSALYGQFLDARTYVYISEKMDGVIVEGEREARFDGCDVYSLSPNRDRLLIMDTWGESISMVDSSMDIIWTLSEEYSMVPVAWSPDGSKVVVSTGGDYFSVIDVESGQVIESIESFYDLVFLSLDETYAVDYDGEIVNLTKESLIDTDAPAFWAAYGNNNKIIYFEYPDEYSDFSYDSLHVYDLSTGEDTVIAYNVMFMDAPVPSVKIEGDFVYFTEKDALGMHRVIVMDYITNEVLFESLPSEDIIIFPDVRPE